MTLLKITRLAFLCATTLLATGACKGKGNPAATDTLAASLPTPRLSWSRAYIVTPAGNAPAAMYFTIDNTTAKPDTLLRVTTSLVDLATLHKTMSAMSQDDSGKHPMHGNMTTVMTMVMTMVPVTTLEVAADTVYQLAPGGAHVMLRNLKHSIARGDSIDVTLYFARAGVLSGKAAVIAYADVDSATAPRPATR